MKYLIIILLPIFKIGYTQTDTIYGIVMLDIGTNIGQEYCSLQKVKNKTYHEQIGESFHWVGLAYGWFKMTGTCLQEVDTLPILECDFDLTQGDIYIKYKRGKLYSGRIRDKYENYRILGSCRKGLLHGKVKIKDDQKNIVWEGEMSHGLLTNP